MKRIRYVVETLHGVYECTDWARVCCPCYDCQSPQQIVVFIVFQTQDGVWHFIEDADINVIMEEEYDND